MISPAKREINRLCQEHFSPVVEDLPEGQEESLNSGTHKLCLVGFTASPAAVNLEITAGISGLWPYFIVLLSTRITVGSWKNLSLLRGLC